MGKGRTGNATETFWNSMASRYDAEVFNTLKSDRNDRLGATIRRYGRGAKVIGDFGCGVGRFLTLICGLSQRVVAVDFSRESVALARKQFGHLPNLAIDRVDLAVDATTFCRADLGLSINVLVMPDIIKRRSILKNTWRNLRSGAHLILVVPSLESALYTYTRYAEWYEREGDSVPVALRKAERDAKNEVVSLAGGLVEIDGVSTKHFLSEEILVLLRQNKFEPIDRLRVEYGWKEDIADPPRWLREPYPWDWLFVARRK